MGSLGVFVRWCGSVLMRLCECICEMCNQFSISRPHSRRSTTLNLSYCFSHKIQQIFSATIRPYHTRTLVIGGVVWWCFQFPKHKRRPAQIIRSAAVQSRKRHGLTWKCVLHNFNSAKFSRVVLIWSSQAYTACMFFLYCIYAYETLVVVSTIVHPYTPQTKLPFPYMQNFALF